MNFELRLFRNIKESALIFQPRPVQNRKSLGDRYEDKHTAIVRKRWSTNH